MREPVTADSQIFECDVCSVIDDGHDKVFAPRERC